MKKKLLIICSVLIILIVSICIGVIVVKIDKDQDKNNPLLPFEIEEGKYIGIMYIGGSEDSYDYTLVNKYYEKNEFETIDIGGEEKYLVIPLGNSLSIYSLELTEDGGVDEKLIRKTIISPVYIKCNRSDIFSNCMLRITINGKQYSYSPYISLKDGSLVVEDFVFNICK